MNTITVTKPSLPPLEEYVELLKDIWRRQWLTNQGHYHNALEQELAGYLGVPHVSLFCNGMERICQIVRRPLAEAAA